MKKELFFILSLAYVNVSAIKATSDFIAKATPGFLEIEGKGGKVDATKATIMNNKIAGTFTIPIGQLKTGIEERDGHMLGYLEEKKFPEASFRLDPIEIAKDSKKEFTGYFTLHGVVKEVKGEVEFKGDKIAVAKFQVDVTAYGIKVPTYKLLTVGKIVDIKVSLEI